MHHNLQYSTVQAWRKRTGSDGSRRWDFRRSLAIGVHVVFAVLPAIGVPIREGRIARRSQLLRHPSSRWRNIFSYCSVPWFGACHFWGAGFLCPQETEMVLACILQNQFPRFACSAWPRAGAWLSAFRKRQDTPRHATETPPIISEPYRTYLPTSPPPRKPDVSPVVPYLNPLMRQTRGNTTAGDGVMYYDES